MIIIYVLEIVFHLIDIILVFQLVLSFFPCLFSHLGLHMSSNIFLELLSFSSLHLLWIEIAFHHENILFFLSGIFQFRSFNVFNMHGIFLVVVCSNIVQILCLSVLNISIFENFLQHGFFILRSFRLVWCFPRSAFSIVFGYRRLPWRFSLIIFFLTDHRLLSFGGSPWLVLWSFPVMRFIKVFEILSFVSRAFLSCVSSRFKELNFSPCVISWSFKHYWFLILFKSVFSLHDIHGFGFGSINNWLFLGLHRSSLFLRFPKLIQQIFKILHEIFFFLLLTTSFNQLTECIFVFFINLWNLLDHCKPIFLLRLYHGDSLLVILAHKFLDNAVVIVFSELRIDFGKESLATDCFSSVIQSLQNNLLLPHVVNRFFNYSVVVFISNQITVELLFGNNVSILISCDQSQLFPSFFINDFIHCLRIKVLPYQSWSDFVVFELGRPDLNIKRSGQRSPIIVSNVANLAEIHDLHFIRILQLNLLFVLNSLGGFLQIQFADHFSFFVFDGQSVFVIFLIKLNVLEIRITHVLGWNFLLQYAFVLRDFEDFCLDFGSLILRVDVLMDFSHVQLVFIFNQVQNMNFRVFILHFDRSFEVSELKLLVEVINYQVARRRSDLLNRYLLPWGISNNYLLGVISQKIRLCVSNLIEIMLALILRRNYLLVDHLSLFIFGYHLDFSLAVLSPILNLLIIVTLSDFYRIKLLNYQQFSILILASQSKSLRIDLSSNVLNNVFQLQKIAQIHLVSVLVWIPLVI